MREIKFRIKDEENKLGMNKETKGLNLSSEIIVFFFVFVSIMFFSFLFYKLSLDPSPLYILPSTKAICNVPDLLFRFLFFIS